MSLRGSVGRMSRLGPWQPATADERLDRLESLAEIQQLAVRYALALDSRDMDMMVELFVPDVRVGRDEVGREALKRWYDRTMSFPRVSCHFVGNHVISLGAKQSVAGVVSLTGASVGVGILILTVMITPIMIAIVGAALVWQQADDDRRATWSATAARAACSPASRCRPTPLRRRRSNGWLRNVLSIWRPMASSMPRCVSRRSCTPIAAWACAPWWRDSWRWRLARAASRPNISPAFASRTRPSS